MKQIKFILVFSICNIYLSCSKVSESPQPQIISSTTQGSGKILFWTKETDPSNFGYGLVPITISIEGQTKVLSSFYDYPGPTAPLACTTFGTLRFDVSTGLHIWKAMKNNLQIATGTVYISINDCVTQEILQ